MIERNVLSFAQPTTAFDLSRSTADVALALLKRFELKNWYFTSCKQFFASAGQGPYINWRGIAHYINPEGEVVDKQTWIEDK